MIPTPVTAAGRAGLAALLADPGQALVALDFDGTLAPIVADPAEARALPEAVAALRALAPLLGTLAVITGRPAAKAVSYGSLDRVPGIIVLGHYGRQRWAEGTLVTQPPPPGLQTARDRLPAVLAAAGAADGTLIEDKAEALAVHTRRAAAPGADKGHALRDLAAEDSRSAIMFGGDDLGDRPAFRAIRELRAAGQPGLAVCSASAEVAELAAEADLVVDGPSGITALLAWLAQTISG